MQTDILKKKMNINTQSLTYRWKQRVNNKYQDVWSVIKNKKEAISSGECHYEKDYMKIKFNSNDNLPLKKPLKFHVMTIIIRSVFEEDGKLDLQLFLDETLYELSI